jgi:predicted enzyme related to lactoylglutathione lyase
VALDPTGAAFGVWQAAAHHGAQLVGEPVSLTWNELQSTDTDAAGRFYADVFGHDWSRQDGGGELTYHVANLGGRRVAGMMTLPPSAAEMGAPSHWEPVFAVDDVDETHRRAVELGAEALSEPRDYPGVGRGSVLRDPSGAVFQILRAESA